MTESWTPVSLEAVDPAHRSLTNVYVQKADGSFEEVTDWAANTTVVPPDSPEGDPWATAPFVGTYDGNPGAAEPGEEKTKRVFLKYPAIALSYYNYNQRLNFNAESNRLNKRIWCCITWDTKVDGGGTGVNEYLTHMGNRSGTGYTRMLQYVDDLVKLDAVAQAADMRIVATIDHEFENNWHQGKFLASVGPEEFAAALSNFFTEIKDAAPRVIRAWWVGYYNFNRTSDNCQVRDIGEMFTERPQIITMDPYQESHTQTFTTMVNKYVNQVKQMNWWQRNPIPFAISETSMRSGYPDSAGNIFYDSWHEQMRAMDDDVKFAVNFNRDTGIAQQIDPVNDPQSTEKFRASLAGA